MSVESLLGKVGVERKCGLLKCWHRNILSWINKEIIVFLIKAKKKNKTKTTLSRYCVIFWMERVTTSQMSAWILREQKKVSSEESFESIKYKSEASPSLIYNMWSQVHVPCFSFDVYVLSEMMKSWTFHGTPPSWFYSFWLKLHAFMVFSLRLCHMFWEKCDVFILR